jgi:hypothetical protein
LPEISPRIQGYRAAGSPFQQDRNKGNIQNRTAVDEEQLCENILTVLPSVAAQSRVFAVDATFPESSFYWHQNHLNNREKQRQDELNSALQA